MYMAPHLDVLHQVVLKALYGMRFASQRTLVGSRARERDFPGLPVLGPCRPAGGGGTCLPARAPLGSLRGNLRGALTLCSRSTRTHSD